MPSSYWQYLRRIAEQPVDPAAVDGGPLSGRPGPVTEDAPEPLSDERFIRSRGEVGTHVPEETSDDRLRRQ